MRKVRLVRLGGHFLSSAVDFFRPQLHILRSVGGVLCMPLVPILSAPETMTMKEEVGEPQWGSSDDSTSSWGSGDDSTPSYLLMSPPISKECGDTDGNERKTSLEIIPNKQQSKILEGLTTDA
ncbi:hypothetical protein J6590_060618 [Homalodisca vitripennis]|nr:hypothetical protein J6590_060618 [Homalodisca vitripennis]